MLLVFSSIFQLALIFFLGTAEIEYCLLKDNLQKLLEDDGFKVKSERATKALEAAADLLTWCMAEESKKELDSFSD